MDPVFPARPDADWSLARYEAVRARLPPAAGAAETRPIASLEEIAGKVDAFALDAFGVLNVGETAIPGAAERLARLRALGKKLMVLTNGATLSRHAALAKYHAMGFDFAPEEVISSRDLAVAALDALAPGAVWAAACGRSPDFADMPAALGGRVRDWLVDPALAERADGFLFLSSHGWTPEWQARLVAALRERPRPLVVANPDIVAPRESGFTLEPGHFAHSVADATGIAPRFFGKPFPEAYAEVLRRLPGIAPGRIAAVGDTPHTDILGGRAAGFLTFLVADHGLLAGRDAAAAARACALGADFVCASI